MLLSDGSIGVSRSKMWGTERPQAVGCREEVSLEVRSTVGEDCAPSQKKKQKSSATAEGPRNALFHEVWEIERFRTEK